MGDFNSASLWMKVALLVTVVAFGMHLFAFTMPGWASYDGLQGTNCNNNGWCRSTGGAGVEFCEVVGFLCLLIAVFLALCLVFLDELNGNKGALIAFVVVALLGGLLIIIGAAVYNAEFNVQYTYSTLVTVMCGLLALLAGVFGILDIVGVKA